ncbi:MAG: 2Fe-2S iron-sulfur cluster-binding protein [Pseudomonadota bacterium]|nr:2Fe-2S iron-sulfur cluster-binding protein [Pseudomonadota bacterium]
MVKVVFIERDGARREVTGAVGDSLLDVAHAHDIDMEGTCEGQMACSTCHVLVAKEWFAQLPEASEDEEDMLDLAYGVRPTSRLSCQITLTDALDGLEVTIPADAHDMSGR